MRSKLFLVLSLFAATAAAVSCSNEPVVDETIVVKPTTIFFSLAHPATQDIAITHTCTCPFNWNILKSNSWLIVPGQSSGDQNTVPISIDTSIFFSSTSDTSVLNKLQRGDTLNYTAKVTSNFGDQDLTIKLMR